MVPLEETTTGLVARGLRLTGWHDLRVMFLARRKDSSEQVIFGRRASRM